MQIMSPKKNPLFCELTILLYIRDTTEQYKYTCELSLFILLVKNVSKLAKSCDSWNCRFHFGINLSFFSLSIQIQM